MRNLYIQSMGVLLLLLIGGLVFIRFWGSKPPETPHKTDRPLGSAETPVVKDTYFSQLDPETQKLYKAHLPEWSETQISFALENLTDWGDPLSEEFGVHLSNFIAEQKTALKRSESFAKEMKVFGSESQEKLVTYRAELSRLQKWLEASKNPLFPHDGHGLTKGNRYESPPSRRNFIMEERERKLQSVSESEMQVPTSESWQEVLKTDISDLKMQIREKYPEADTLADANLNPEAYAEFYPTEESRQSLRVQQQEMQAELVSRVEELLSNDFGNREEKLTIIRQTLSANWGPEITESVLEELR